MIDARSVSMLSRSHARDVYFGYVKLVIPSGLLRQINEPPIEQ